MGTDSFILYFCTKLLYNAQTIAIRTPSWEQINECGPPFLKEFVTDFCVFLFGVWISFSFKPVWVDFTEFQVTFLLKRV